MKKTVVIGLLGPTLDRGTEASRWEFWRPSVSLCQHEDLVVDRFDLISEKKFDKLTTTVSQDIESVSPETTVRRHEIHFRDAWDFEDVYGALHDFARQYPFDTENEDYLLHITTGTHVAQICLFLLAESRHFPAQLIQTAPPTKRKTGAPGPFRIIDLDLSRYDRIAQRHHTEQRESVSFLKSGIDTRNKAFNQLIEQIEHVAIHAQDPVLITGPTGAGKSQLARRIFDLKSKRRQIEGRFVEINCATIRGDAAMSALFGHKKGAFTGAAQDRKGLLSEADQGLLFLDEIGELGPDEQAMLLHAIEEKRYLPLGSDRESESDFQLICGTNRNLLADVGAGRFREDLLSRINLWTFQLPGLAQRPEDIPPNVDYELQRLTGRTGKQVRFNTEAQKRFLNFAQSQEAQWSGNFRDLNAAITRMATMAPSGRITEQVVNDEIARLQTQWTGGKINNDAALLQSILTDEQIAQIDRFDRVQLAEVIRVCQQSKNISQAGRTLFAASRQRRKTSNDADRLRKYLAKFGITWRVITDSRQANL